jgi:hypothetical protein
LVVSVCPSMSVTTPMSAAVSSNERSGYSSRLGAGDARQAAKCGSTELVVLAQ